ncbi:MAG: VOC family protein [Methylotetracoccus sp.]
MSGTLIQPYLFFGGRCDEAIAFYREALGATVELLMRFDESPDPAPPGTVPPGFERKVMHATLRIGGAVLMASDGCDESTRFDGFRLSLALPTEERARVAFASLANGGEIQMPLCETFWSPCFGMLTDRFGVGWMVTVTAGET